MFRVLFHEPRIAGNTGNTIRLAAGTGAELHVVNPLFDFEDNKLKRAGLDYHDLAVVTRHETLAAAWETLLPARVFAFTTSGTTQYDTIEYQPGDVARTHRPERRGPGRSGNHRSCAHSDAGWPSLDEPRKLRCDRDLRGVASARLCRWPLSAK